MRHPCINLSYAPLLSDYGFHLSLLEGWDRTAKKPWVVTVEDPEIRVVPDDLIPVVEVVRSVVLDRAIHQRLMPVPVRARKRHSSHTARLLRPDGESLRFLLIDGRLPIVLNEALKMLARITCMCYEHLDCFIVLPLRGLVLHFI